MLSAREGLGLLTVASADSESSHPSRTLNNYHLFLEPSYIHSCGLALGLSWIPEACTSYCILPRIITLMFLCALYMGLLYPLLYPWYVIIIPMHSAHPYFPLKDLGKIIHNIHSKIQYISKFFITRLLGR